MSDTSSMPSVSDRVLWVLGVLIMGVIFVVTVLGIVDGPSGPAEPHARVTAVEQRDDGSSDAAIEIHNRGGETAADVRVSTTSGDQKYDAEVRFLAPDQREMVHFVLPDHVSKDDITVDVLGWAEP